MKALSVIGLAIPFLLLSSIASAEDINAKVVHTNAVFQNQAHQTAGSCTPRRSIGGTLIGGAIGAALGNQVGGGSGQDIATAVGAVTGAAIGQNVAQNCVGNVTYVQTILYYEITVEVNGSLHTVQRQYSPAIGSYMPVNITVF
jgi:uncharacterized protein YcfJ